MAAALLAGLLTAPAHAQQGPNLRLGGIGNIELRVGSGPQSVTIQVENNTNDQVTGTAENVRLTMTVPLAEFGVHIASAPNGCNRTNDNTRMDCNLGNLGPGDGRNLVAQIGVQGNSPLQSGETRNGSAQVALENGGQTSFNIRLQGPERAPSVANVSGVVTEQSTGEGIEGAQVFVTDSQGVDFTRTTNANGEFSFQGEQIAAGSIGLRASKDGYESNSVTQNAQAGQSLTGIQLSLRSTATPTTAPPPTSAPPPTTGGPTVAAPLDETSSGGGTFTTIMIIIGILFVLLGIGAIVLLIIRRRREQDDDEGPEGADGPISGPRGPGPVPGSHGVYRPTPTQVMGPRGPVPAAGPSPALANAQTMMHPRAGGADETAMLPRAGDPAATRAMGPRPPVPGSPPPPRPAAPTYGGGSPERYDDQTQAGQGYGGQPRSPYGSPAGRHDRGGYRSSYENSSYGPDPYAQPQPSYEQGGDYRGAGGGYGGGYDRPTSADYHPGHRDPGRGYDQSGYNQPGYDQPGYDQSRYDQSRYGQEPPPPQHGYGTDYPGEPAAPRSRHAAEPPPPPERRRLDWLDQ